MNINNNDDVFHFIIIIINFSSISSHVNIYFILCLFYSVKLLLYV
jgi:hypothetical protein